MSASSDVIITVKVFRCAFMVPQKIISRYKKQFCVTKEIKSRPNWVRKEIGSIYHVLLLFAE